MSLAFGERNPYGGVGCVLSLSFPYLLGSVNFLVYLEVNLEHLVSLSYGIHHGSVMII